LFGGVAGWALLGVAFVGVSSLVCCGGLAIHHAKDLAKALEPDDPEPVPVTAESLVASYLVDARDAENKYTNSFVEVTGTVAETGKDAELGTYVLLEGGAGGKGMSVRCLFPDDDEDALARIGKLRKGNEVTIQGDCNGLENGHVQITDCVIAK
jgi:hypothetical protein